MTFMGDRAPVAQQPCFSGQAEVGRPEVGLCSGRSAPLPSLHLEEVHGIKGRRVSCGHSRPLQSVFYTTLSDLLQRRGNRARPSVVPQLLGHSPASLRGLRVLPSLVLPSLVMYHAPGILHSNSHSQAPHTTFSPSATCA